MFIQENPDKQNPVTFDCVSYKPESTMLLESQQLAFAVAIANSGYKVIINERIEVINEIKSSYGNLFQYKERE